MVEIAFGGTRIMGIPTTPSEKGSFAIMILEFRIGFTNTPTRLEWTGAGTEMRPGIHGSGRWLISKCNSSIEGND